MANVPGDLLYTAEHEYVRDRGDGVVEIGVTDYAQDELGDVVYLDLPEVGRTITAGDSFGSIESVKAVSELFAPMSGEVVAVNQSLDGAPATINEDAEGKGWFFRLKLSSPEQLDALMSEEQYKSFLKTLE